MYAHIARRHRQCRDRFADDADDLRRVGLEFAAHDLPRQRHGQGEQLALYLSIECVERLCQVVEHAREPIHLRLHFGATGAAPLGQSLLEGLLVRLSLQVRKTAHGRHFLRHGRALHVGHRPQCNIRAGLEVGVRQTRPPPCRRD